MIRPEGPPGVCWTGGGRDFAREPCAEFDGLTWCDGTPHVDWRAAAYERAATRPCRRISDNFALFGLACWRMNAPNARCQPSVPVAR